MLRRCMLICFVAGCAADSCADLKAALDAWIANNNEGFGGAVLRIQKEGHEAYTLTNGVLHVRTTDTMQASTLIEVASVTKSLVSALILKKVLANSIALTSTVEDILGSDLPSNLFVVNGTNQTGNMKLDQLLLHTSGLYHFWGDGQKQTVDTWYTSLNLPKPTSHPAWSQYANVQVNRFDFESVARRFLESGFDENKIWKPSEVLSLCAGYYDSFPIGQFHYSDTGYVILGMAVERLYEKSLGEAIQQDLFTPLLGTPPMDTFMRYNVGLAMPTDNAAEGSNKYARLSHRYFNDATVGRYDTTMTDKVTFPTSTMSSYHNSADWAAGGLVTTASELGRFWVALMTSTSSPWSDVRSLMLSPASNYKYGVESIRGVLGHTGDGGAVMLFDELSKIVITGTNNNNKPSFADFVRADSTMNLIRSCAATQPPGNVSSTSATTELTTTASLPGATTNHASASRVVAQSTVPASSLAATMSSATTSPPSPNVASAASDMRTGLGQVAPVVATAVLLYARTVIM